jgi:hypothetical protein
MTKFLPGRNLSQSIDLEKNYYNRYIGELEKKIEDKRSPDEYNSLFYYSERPAKVNKEYGEELKRQIESKVHQKNLELLEFRKPAISQDFHGYPNIPQTPKEIRRKRELLKMTQVREDLLAQQALKKQERESSKFFEIESARSQNMIENQLIQSEKAAKQQKKDFVKETLTTAWQQALKAKELKDKLEDFEAKPLLRKNQNIEKQEGFLINRTDNVSPLSHVQTEVVYQEASPKNVIERFDKKEGLKQKAKKIKEYLEKKEGETYQHKIKKIVKEAKDQRMIIKQNSPLSNYARQISPHQSGNRKVF